MKNKIIGLVFVLLNISCATQEIIPVDPGPFLKDSYEARSFLKRSLSSVPKGITLVTPANKADVLDVNWPGDALVATVTENLPWKNHSHYNFILDLSDIDLMSYNQTDSSAMTASVLLDYYFSKLVNRDFKVAGEHHTFIYHPIQFASNTWFKKEYNIIITGSVYINVEYKNAVVTADISEIFE
ncbi:MAG: hypothetical protein JXA96_08090 [Sedimentisphaerales bacterium]|nr:hypothetical protein [Sedimentisphaerales bacterium]